MYTRVATGLSRYALEITIIQGPNVEMDRVTYYQTNISIDKGDYD